MLAAVSRLIYTVKVIGVIALHQSETIILGFTRKFFIFYFTFFCYYRNIYV